MVHIRFYIKHKAVHPDVFTMAMISFRSNGITFAVQMPAIAGDFLNIFVIDEGGLPTKQSYFCHTRNYPNQKSGRLVGKDKRDNLVIGSDDAFFIN